MSRMLRTNDCVPAGTFAHLIACAGPSPGAAPSAAWLNFAGVGPASGSPETVRVIAGAAGAPARCPACARAATGIATDRTLIETTNHSLALMLLLLIMFSRLRRVRARIPTPVGPTRA